MEFTPLTYEGTVIRPPSEADSLIVQVTLGCSDNRCTFCPAYKDKPYRVKPPAQVEAELRWAAPRFPGTRKIFLADGDAVGLPQAALERILETAAALFPRLARVGVYGSIKSIETKTVDELRRLKERRLGIVYLGFETGDDEVYRAVKKYGSPQGNIDTCRKVKEAGIKTNATVILGLGGTARSAEHAVNTARMLSAAQPHQVAALTLMVVDGTPLALQRNRGEFNPLDDFAFVRELKTLLENLSDFPCLFFANHASNFYPITARFPKDRPAVIAELDRVLLERNPRRLRPDGERQL